MPTDQKPSRRTVARSFVWTAPAVVISAAGPAATASATPCPTLPAAYSCTASSGDCTGTSVSGPTSFDTTTGKITMYSDATTASADRVITESGTISGLTSGRWYSIALDVQTNQGYMANGACTTYGTFMEVLVGGTVQQLGTTAGVPGRYVGVTTDSAYKGTNAAVQAPSDSCTNGGSRNAGLTRTAVVTYYVTFQATGATMPLDFRFTMQASSQGNSDDFWVTPHCPSLS